mmetsp:Transcript_2870/g.3968  ORF Transcript_2870/g.3968 Transcript_2870/m.3968 type:complete len:142 (+) Transcript_2870:67-492(+)|eukprot:CAMPEP_0114349656 /NCGR_PEP_ID=MMETSP0101-20121206/15704_1 /TAXON_ID=38822 ORGANISM="Pteridomonas danica, Strain PT" /NCGR_SAMPLE_ID=MMETSP0101 /ASSEMBLY_ACC=CAM_ASM_000211 /LENGTH=141 /DNA_ID=CAMNT_0001488355 /DNA_START=70 /DNA_END=495 /DNA_ORIENTATION=+
MEEVHEARNAACAEAVKVLSTGMTPKECLDTLNRLIEKNDLPSMIEFCERAEDATMSSPFVDQLAVFTQLDIIYDKIYFEKKAARKIAFKKFRFLEEDKKTEAATLEESRKVKDDIDVQCAKLSLKSTEIKLIIGPPDAAS